MSVLYVFNPAGACTHRVIDFDEERLDELLIGLKAASYAVSDTLVELLKARLVNGVVVQVDDTPALDRQWEAVRSTRNGLLADSDWTQLPDVALSAGAKVAWASYRHELRNVTSQTDPFNILWPQPPQNS